MTEALLEVEALATGYSAPVIGPVSFRIETGEVVGLVGPNGSGKSTLLKAIADIAPIFSGRVVRRPGLQIAWMEQQPVRMDQMPFSGWEYLRFNKANHLPPPQRLAEYLDARIDSLSGGQFQLLSCWSVLGTSAELILLDEPTSNLDEESAGVLREALIRDRESHVQRAVLIVSHKPAFLEAVCDRVLEIGA